MRNYDEIALRIMSAAFGALIVYALLGGHS